MKNLTGTIVAMILVGLLGASAPAFAAALTIPNTFTANTPARAADVNANFAAVSAAVNDNDARIAALEALVAALQSQIDASNTNVTGLENRMTTAEGNVATLQGQMTAANTSVSSLGTRMTAAEGKVTTLQNQMATVNANTVLGLNNLLTYDAVYKTARFTGVNVQVVSGSGSTGGAVNGLGNLIVGYNEPFYMPVCSLGIINPATNTYYTTTDCTTTGRINTAYMSFTHRGGSHNLVVGSQNQYSSYGGLVVGSQNMLIGVYSSVVGGSGNTAVGFESSVSGGNANTASGSQSSISGGVSNLTSGQFSSISGGSDNTASGFGSSILGGSMQGVSTTYGTAPMLP